MSQSEFLLTPAEKVSSAWLKIMRNVEAQLECARMSLEGSKDLDETNIIRGRIRAYRWVLSLHEDRPSVMD